MKGFPKFIQTPADLDNLFDMTKSGELSGAVLTSQINDLLRKQYHSVPILEASGTKITTHYFPECTESAVTDDGLTVNSVKHIEDKEHDGQGVQYSETQITLSKAPEETTVLSIFMPENFLTQNGFDMSAINYILGVLAR